MTPSQTPSYPFIIRPSVLSVLVTLSREMSVSQVVGAVPSAGSREPGAEYRVGQRRKGRRGRGGEGRGGVDKIRLGVDHGSWERGIAR
jgi:hypothetical protein